MRNIQTRILALLLVVLLLLGLTACGEEIAGLTENVFSEPGITETAVSEEIPDEPETPEAPEAEADTGTSDSAVTEGEYYYDLEHVVLYLDRYGVLPDNYITKDEARAARRAAAGPRLSARGARISGLLWRKSRCALRLPAGASAHGASSGRGRAGAGRAVCAEDRTGFGRGSPGRPAAACHTGKEKSQHGSD